MNQVLSRRMPSSAVSAIQTSSALRISTRSLTRPFGRRVAFSSSSRNFRYGLESLEQYGSFKLVLPENPTTIGVAHITPNVVPSSITPPPYVSGMDVPGPSKDSFIALGTEEEASMRRASRLARRVLEVARTHARVGVSTASIDARLHDFILQEGAYPSPLLYQGFPKSCCTSVNNVIVHGIPDGRRLEDGDIVNVDVTVYVNGFHGDCSETFPVGNVDRQGMSLISVSNEALAIGISACGPGRPFKGIGSAISSFVKSHGCSVNADFTGHGIGRIFHQTPWILHHKNDEPGVMKPGHCFTVEPAIVQGDDPRAWMLPDGWTVLTETGARSAQAEHTVLITDEGVEILTE